MVAVKEVQLPRILIAAGALDEPEAEKADIEIDIGLHVAGDQGDVVDAGGHGWILGAWENPHLASPW